MDINPSDLEPLVNFLRTGKLGKLELGMTVDDVLDYLGLPINIQSIDELRDQQPQLWQTETTQPNVFPSLYYGCLAPMFQRTRLKQLILIPQQYPIYSLPKPFHDNDEWMKFINQHLTTHDALRAFLNNRNLTHIRHNKVRLPSAWLSDDPYLEINIDFSISTSGYIKAIRSGDLFA